MGFGLDKLKIIEWLYSLILLKDEGVCKKLDELQFPRKLVELMKTYPMNSMMHLKVSNVIMEAMNSDNEHYVETVCCVYTVVRDQAEAGGPTPRPLEHQPHRKLHLHQKGAQQGPLPLRHQAFQPPPRARQENPHRPSISQK